ncbi:hypothetical protein ACFFQF_07625 [Haladaptatus pallidirubidus]|uniref:hypothetical protein n=1 Tax=Haladaptatus pallidirubidus TaxID=1008152 RepID=UPI001D103B59|nr:hypothetical protein [Haladaptatus pallidirubidus]
MRVRNFLSSAGPRPRTCRGPSQRPAVVTNQVQSNSDAFFGEPTRPVGGNGPRHASACWSHLQRSKKDERIVRLANAPNLTDGEAVFRMTDDGVKPEYRRSNHEYSR